MSETRASDPQYIVEYADGPLAGTTDRRYLVGGTVDARIGAVAAVDSLESVFWYVAGEERTVAGEKHVSYHFDPQESDPVEADQADESLYGYGA
jgi:hypothetical protein